MLLRLCTQTEIYLKGLRRVNIILDNKIKYSFTNSRKNKSTELNLGYDYL